MTAKLTLFILFISYFSFGQTFKISPSDSTYFVSEKNKRTKHQVICSPWYFFELNDSIPDGEYRIYISDAKSSIASTGTIKNHKKEGLWTSYYESGAVLSKENFKDGYLNGKCSEYTKAGKLVFEADFLFNQLNGTVYHFDPGYATNNYHCSSGQLKKEFEGQFGQFTYLNGSRHGAANFQKNNVNTTCIYKFDKLHGDVIYRNSFNQLLSISKYDNGKFLSSEVFKSLTNETTYFYGITIMPEKYPETLESLKQKLTKLDSCHNLHHLTILNFSTENSFDSIIQEYLGSIPKFKHLTSLELAGKGFSQIPPAIFDCDSLTSLSLEDLSITKLSNKISNLKALETLKLGLIRFENKEKLIRQISKLPSLREFTSYHWLGTFPENWNRLKQIEVMRIQPVRRIHSDSIPSSFHKNLFKLKNLEYLLIPSYLFDQHNRDFQEKMPKCQVDEIISCFEKSTLISLANNQKKTIDKMEIGDVIFAFDIVTQKIDTATVLKLHIHDIVNQDLLQLTFNENVDLVIKCTSNHPFRTMDNSWKEASELIVGDTLIILNESTMTLNKVRINKIGEIKNVNQVFNISTSKKNYFANGILVHNK